MSAVRRKKRGSEAPVAASFAHIGWLGNIRVADATSSLSRMKQLGFDTVAVGLDPEALLQAEEGISAELQSQLAAAGAAGLQLCIDIDIGRLLQPRDLGVASGDVGFDSDGDPPDPRRSPAGTAAPERPAGRNLLSLPQLEQRLAALSSAGVAALRCLSPHRASGDCWRSLREAAPALQFWAWTPGLSPDQLRGLSPAGFDAVFSSAPWWDFRDTWWTEEFARLQQLGNVLVPLGGNGATAADAQSLLRAARFAAAAGAGVFVFLDEPAWRDALQPDLSESAVGPDGVAAALAAALAERDPRAARDWAQISAGPGRATALLGSLSGGRSQRRLLLVNPDLDHVAPVDVAAVRAVLADHAPSLPEAGLDPLEPGELRQFRLDRAPPAVAPLKSLPQLTDALTQPRVVIERVEPQTECGRYPVRRVVGDRLQVSASIFSDGHESLGAQLLWRRSDQRDWQAVPMRALGNDRWCVELPLDRVGLISWRIEAWRDAFATARIDVEKRRAADKLSDLDVAEAIELVAGAVAALRGSEGDSAQLRQVFDELQTLSGSERVAKLLDPELARLMAALGPRAFIARSDELRVDVERTAAAFASWYELFPRSAAASDQVHGTFDDVIPLLPRIRAMGFDVLYLPPIHPIGRQNRKGRNNSLTAGPDDPGSPYAIGSEEGGHDALHPQLGDFDSFQRLLKAAAEHGLEMALDFAIQCSPDHPWLKQHPEWFAYRADGSIRYAENPPKRYEDIVNVEFHGGADDVGLWQALRDIVMFWVERGVKLFRVDNPHTKPFAFWEWLIADVRGRDPDVVFLSEAFTRPGPMYRLARVGFSQSYTYFTWRNDKRELTEYFTELAGTAVKEYFRPHLFVNTPDINPKYLQTSGRPGHLVRAALATTLSGLWGVYAPFELCEAEPMPGKEEYHDSEKYTLRQWDWQRPGNISAEIGRLNAIRRLNPALHTHLGVRFYNAFNEQILYYGKRAPGAEDMILIAVNLDPHHAQSADFEAPLWEWGLGDDGSLLAENLWTGATSIWHGKRQRLWLDPAQLPFSIWRVRPVHGGVQ